MVASPFEQIEARLKRLESVDREIAKHVNDLKRRVKGLALAGLALQKLVALQGAALRVLDKRTKKG